MNSVRTLVSRIPAVIWSGVLALVLALFGGGIWSLLLTINIASSPAIPWSVVVMALLLWLVWQYLGGRWGPQSTSEARRRYLRATPVPGPVFAWALLAGMLSIVALIGFWIVLFQLVKVPGNALPDFSTYPLLTVALVLVMASVVAAVAEETGFRGYFQGILERELHSPLAIVISALVIAPGHALTQGFVWPTMLWYFFVDLMFGGLAYFTKSILPGVVVHGVGILIFFTVVWPQDAQRRLIWDTGADIWFWLNAAQAIIFTLLALLAFRQLARITKQRSAAEPNIPLPQPASRSAG
jgi:membrane protease YdiL (CAAX protease family)